MGQTVITHAPVLVKVAGGGALMEMDPREAAEFVDQGIALEIVTPAPVAPVTICTHFLTMGRDTAWLKQPIMLERMRLCKRDFRRGLAGDYRRYVDGGPRRLLPLVSR